jgi:hypothetical protein
MGALESRLVRLEVLRSASIDDAVRAAAWAIEGHLRYGDLADDQRAIARQIITNHGLGAGDVRRAVMIALQRLDMTNAPDDPMDPGLMAAAASVPLGELFAAVAAADADEHAEGALMS